MNKKVKELQNINNQLDKKIKKENQIIFTDMICYIRSADISDYHQEIIRHDLSEMILSAQDRGEDIHSLIGRDFKEFCDEVIENLPPKTIKEKIYDGLDIFCSCLAILGVINIVFSNDLKQIIEKTLSNQPANYSFGISLGMILSTILIFILALLIVQLISKNALNEATKAKKYNKILIGATLGAAMVAIFIFIAKVGNQIVFSINIFLVIILIFALYLAHKLLSRI